ncbi:rho GDP-dissociation inhibitor 1-like [Boleophthalmus pectinirostris]|uniref:rho GDP-dissociation inhibitor 1-like n=1 Tax=Boleophthalmus pectinirostris TaxID=150288 RepID=UPI000A1C1B47|nr:rho GDP-dissociation inhibitor 1-like [Boleophthalmus pectinirostris]
MLGVDACEFGGQVVELLWIAMCYRGLVGDEDDAPAETVAFKTPAQKTLEEIRRLDQDDESLVRYKKTLLGVTSSPQGDTPNVQVLSMTLLFDEGSPPLTMDLTGNLSNLPVFTLKEGVQFRIKIVFKVNHEIVSGLKYYHVTSRKGLNVDKEAFMVGSYGPRAEEQEFISSVEEAPKGMIARGHYTIKSRFIDDDKNVHLAWEWGFDIKKDWE